MSAKRPPPTFDEAAPLAERVARLAEEDSETLSEMAQSSGRRPEALALWGAAWRAGGASALRACLSAGRGRLPEEVRSEAVSAVDLWCRARVPDAEQDRVSWVWTVRGTAITIEERHRPVGGTVVETCEVAQFRWEPVDDRWHVLARRGGGGAWWPLPIPEPGIAGCLRVAAALPPPVGA